MSIAVEFAQLVCAIDNTTRLCDGVDAHSYGDNYGWQRLLIIFEFIANCSIVNPRRSCGTTFRLDCLRNFAAKTTQQLHYCVPAKTNE